DTVAVQIYDADTDAMFHFARSQVVEKWSPFFKFSQVFGDMLGEENVAGIATIHDTLREIQASAGEIRSFVYIDNAANWPAVNPHPKLQARMFLERAADLDRALHGRFRTSVKHQRHAITRRDLK